MWIYETEQSAKQRNIYLAILNNQSLGVTIIWISYASIKDLSTYTDNYLSNQLTSGKYSFQNWYEGTQKITATTEKENLTR